MNVEKEIRAIKELLELHNEELEDINNTLCLNALKTVKDVHEFKIYHGYRQKKGFN